MTAPIDDTTLDHLRRIVQEEEVPQHPRYRVGDRIGQGGMGTVYLAEDLALGRPVALKVLRDSRVGAGAMERMVQEARIIAGLEHPGIVPVHDVGRLADGRVFYVMKRVNGRRLDEYFDESAAISQRLRVFERVCEAVAFAHAHGVIHRDLKPQNVMVGQFGEVLVLDWGVAKLASDGSHHAEGSEASPVLLGSLESAVVLPTRRDQNDSGGEKDRDATAGPPQTAYGTVLGTPAYMPPEQARGEIDRIDQRSDVYSLGGILYFLLTGDAPRAAASGQAAAAITPPRQRNRGVARRLQSICLKALASSPDDRFGSAAELAADVSRFLNGQAVSAHRESALERLGRWVGWYRTPILLIAAYLLVRAVLILWQRR